MNYRENLMLTIDKWNADAIEDEWLFDTFRKKFIDSLPSVEAFELINETIEILLVQDDESTAIEVLQTAIGLARHSETTQIPDIVLINKKALEERFANFGDYAKSKLLEFFRYYRL